jgi:hypothetical protein
MSWFDVFIALLISVHLLRDGRDAKGLHSVFATPVSKRLILPPVSSGIRQYPPMTFDLY